MLQSLEFMSTSTVYDPYHNKHTVFNFQLFDDEFGVVTQNLPDNNCAGVRIILAEYGARNLNVTYNLKLYLSYVFGHIEIGALKAARYTRKGTEEWVNNTQYLMNQNYSHMKFDNHYTCLMKHVERMHFAGKLT